MRLFRRLYSNLGSSILVISRLDTLDDREAILNAEVTLQRPQFSLREVLIVSRLLRASYRRYLCRRMVSWREYWHAVLVQVRTHKTSSSCPCLGYGHLFLPEPQQSIPAAPHGQGRKMSIFRHFKLSTCISTLN
jgi:hypothetical protein